MPKMEHASRHHMWQYAAVLLAFALPPWLSMMATADVAELALRASTYHDLALDFAQVAPQGVLAPTELALLHARREELLGRVSRAKHAGVDLGQLGTAAIEVESQLRELEQLTKTESGEDAASAAIVRGRAIADRCRDLAAKASRRGDELTLAALGRQANAKLWVIMSWILVCIAVGRFLQTRLVSRARRLADVGERITAVALGKVTEPLRLAGDDEAAKLGVAADRVIEMVTALCALMQRITAGDLTAGLRESVPDDEMSAVAAAMISRLSHALGEVGATARQVENGAHLIREASHSLSQGGTEQASSVEEISTSMTEIGVQANSSAEHARNAKELADDARGAAEAGRVKMNEMACAMSEINAASQQIAKIIKVIDAIAFQTNLLALNAAVEAARAGRHGKGFAVVAEEVRSLAARSAKAARETAELIEDARHKVDHGLSVATETNKSFENILRSSVTTAELVGEISSASSEQAQGIRQVSAGLAQIEQVTARATSSAEQIASGALEVASQASELQRLIAGFQLQNTTQTGAAVMQSSVSKKREKSQVRRLPEPGVDPKTVIALDDQDFGRY